MIKVEYKITVPTGLDKIPAVTPEVVAFREALVAWSLSNGMVDYNMTQPTSTERDLFYTWIDQAALDAFAAHFGQPYTDYYAALVASIQGVGGNMMRIVTTI